jgi:hypothetical protein|tara:strand:+ start:1111 stop:1251 length:141 start_codon:yes stop_codon:yes gene_type:complete
LLEEYPEDQEGFCNFREKWRALRNKLNEVEIFGSGSSMDQRTQKRN